MDKRDINVPRIITYTLALVMAVLIAIFFSDSVKDMLLRTALYAVKTYLPAEGVTLADRDNAEDYTDREGEESTDATQQGSTEKEETTAKDTSVKQEGFYDTPQDILKLIASAEKSASSDKKGGSISEKQYKNEGVTDSFGVVRVKNVNDTAIDIEAILEEKIDLTVSKSEPSVLIFHTHTTETYQILDRDFYAKSFATRTSDEGKNMVRVGDAITAEIEAAGYTVIHDREIHDSRYSGAYGRSREKCLEYLEKYPSIQVVLDIHRDAISLSDGTKIKPVCTLGGQKAAQIMIISGCQEEGNSVTDFPDWRENLTFAVHLQKKLEELFPGITRPLYFSPRKYNMDLTHCSLLLEVGSDANTLGEAVLTGKCIGRAVSEILEEYEVEK